MLVAARQTARISGSFNDCPCSSASITSFLVAAGMRYPANGSTEITPSDNCRLMNVRRCFLKSRAAPGLPLRSIRSMASIRADAVEILEVAL